MKTTSSTYTDFEMCWNIVLLWVHISKSNILFLFEIHKSRAAQWCKKTPTNPTKKPTHKTNPPFFFLHKCNKLQNLSL